MTRFAVASLDLSNTDVQLSGMRGYRLPSFELKSLSCHCRSTRRDHPQNEIGAKIHPSVSVLDFRLSNAQRVILP